ncbi:MAG TPA: hypothetical protein VFK86_03420 [Bauldia sp.]|nr:hypothetical protein [Bauldia sp.]
MIGRTLFAAVLFAAASVGVARAEWFVMQGEDRTCVVTDAEVRGYGKLAGPFATETEASAEKARIAACEHANTDPDPDEDVPAK